MLVLALASPLGAGPVLRLKVRPELSRGNRLAEALPLKRLSEARARRIVQFAEPPSEAQLRALEQDGARILGPVPDHGFLVSLPDGIEVGNASVFPLLPHLKISPLLRLWVSEEPRARLLVEFHDDVTPQEARQIVLREGFAIRENPDLLEKQLLVEGSPEGLERLAEWDEVAYLFPVSRELEEGVPVVPCAGAVIDGGRVAQYVASVGEGWDGPGLGEASLMYSLERLTAQLPPDAVQAEIRRALDEWARYVRVRFLPGGSLSARRNLNFLFRSGSHGDPYPFDGRGRVLAHTFYPAPPNPEPIAGDLHFDDDEAWGIGTYIDLFSIVLHELGHALGLAHSDSPADVMYPYYRMVGGLSEGDIAAIRSLYAPAAEPTPPAEPPSTPAPDPQPPANPEPPPSPPPQPDTTAPQLRIFYPAGTNLLTGAASIECRGYAADNAAVHRVTWSNSVAGSGVAAGTTFWNTGPIPLLFGTNVITIRAFDPSGNQSWRSVMVTRR